MGVDAKQIHLKLKHLNEGIHLIAWFCENNIFMFKLDVFVLAVELRGLQGNKSH